MGRCDCGGKPDLSQIPKRRPSARTVMDSESVVQWVVARKGSKRKENLYEECARRKGVRWPLRRHQNDGTQASVLWYLNRSSTPQIFEQLNTSSPDYCLPRAGRTPNIGSRRGKITNSRDEHQIGSGRSVRRVYLQRTSSVHLVGMTTLPPRRTSPGKNRIRTAAVPNAESTDPICFSRCAITQPYMRRPVHVCTTVVHPPYLIPSLLPTSTQADRSG